MIIYRLTTPNGDSLFTTRASALSHACALIRGDIRTCRDDDARNRVRALIAEGHLDDAVETWNTYLKDSQMDNDALVYMVHAVNVFGEKRDIE